MAHHNHLVGIIELDAVPKRGSAPDKDIGQTLSRLCTSDPELSDSDGIDFATISAPSGWQRIRAGGDDAIAIRPADLQQLNFDLESELAQLLDRLLTVP